jgi:hypothetical protein
VLTRAEKRGKTDGKNTCVEQGNPKIRGRSMVARIYRPAKTAMQSGKAKTQRWLLDYEPEVARTVEPLMGYTSSSDMKQQVRLYFETREEAEAYAKRCGIAYRVEEPSERKVRGTAYADNFKFNRVAPWTH